MTLRSCAKETGMFTPKRTLTLLAALAALILGAATASAQSGLQHSPQSFTFTFDNCPNTGKTLIGVTTSSASAVFLDASSNAVFVATTLTEFVTFTTGQTQTITLSFAAGHGQATGLQGSLITCTSQPALFPFGTAILTVTMFSTPLSAP